MTDISKYKNVSLSKDTYNKIDKIRRVMIPEMIISRSQTITLLVNEKQKKFPDRELIYGRVPGFTAQYLLRSF